MEQKHPLPPFTLETAKQKIQMAEDAWNSQNPEKVSLALIVNGEIEAYLSMVETKLYLF